MALINCKECGHRFSNKAKACPICAAPNKKKPFVTIWGLLFIIIAIAVAGNHNKNDSAQNTTTEDNTPTTINPNHSLAEDCSPTGNSSVLWKAANCKDTPEQRAFNAAQHSNVSAACKKDIHCWGEQYSNDSEVRCAEPVEKLSTYNAKWINSWIEPKFSAFRWLNQENGTLTYVGDKLEFQNGFGAYQNYIYECDYDPSTKTVLNVRAYPGHL
ncbi:MAG: hypothetical protein EOO69_04480 [Moraxellaceae bacterium]|nr:MAG: hypothetical protein EOO69_04480 [Moraxellaceae bacterium]